MRKTNKIIDRGLTSDRARDRTVLSSLAALKEMSVKELKAEWEKLIGTSAPNNSRAFLEFRIAYRIQELAYGGPDRETRRMLDLLADSALSTLLRSGSDYQDLRVALGSACQALIGSYGITAGGGRTVFHRIRSRIHPLIGNLLPTAIRNFRLCVVQRTPPLPDR